MDEQKAPETTPEDMIKTIQENMQNAEAEINAILSKYNLILKIEHNIRLYPKK